MVEEKEGGWDDRGWVVGGMRWVGGWVGTDLV